VRVLLDEMLPAGVADLLPAHDVTTVQAAGFKGLNNGMLLRAAVEARYDVLVTADRNLDAQQNIAFIGIAIVLVRGSRMQDVASQTEHLQTAVSHATHGTMTRVDPG